MRGPFPTRGARLLKTTRHQQDALVLIDRREIVHWTRAWDRMRRGRVGPLTRGNVANELSELDRIAGAFKLLGHADECAMRQHTYKDAVNYSLPSN